MMLKVSPCPNNTVTISLVISSQVTLFKVECLSLSQSNNVNEMRDYREIESTECVFVIRLCSLRPDAS